MFLKKRSYDKCMICKRDEKSGNQMLASSIQKRLMNSVKRNYAIKDNFYYIKSINDILFNNQLLEHDPNTADGDADGDDGEGGQ